MRKVLTLVFCAFMSPAVAAEVVVLSSDQSAAVQKAVSRVLKDPDSAKFSQLSAAKQENGDVQVCGTVNAKNSFGGYVGATPFVGQLIGDVFLLTKVAPSQSEAVNMLHLCDSYGASVVD